MKANVMQISAAYKSYGSGRTISYQVISYHAKETKVNSSDKTITNDMLDAVRCCSNFNYVMHRFEHGLQCGLMKHRTRLHWTTPGG